LFNCCTENNSWIECSGLCMQAGQIGSLVVALLRLFSEACVEQAW
jgi:hypothetical protein